MRFTAKFRRAFPQTVSSRYKMYAEVMHPLDFDPVAYIYRHAYSDKLWNAVTLIHEAKPEILTTAHQFRFRPTYLSNSKHAEWVPEKASVLFGFSGIELPRIEIADHEVPNPAHLRHVLRWVNKAYQYEDNRKQLLKMCYGFMEDFNTPGQLYRFWPSLLPFLSKGEKNRIRSMKIRSPLPRKWEHEEVRADFFASPIVQHFDQALLVMSLLPPKNDPGYPNLRNW